MFCLVTVNQNKALPPLSCFLSGIWSQQWENLMDLSSVLGRQASETRQQGRDAHPSNYRKNKELRAVVGTLDVLWLLSLGILPAGVTCFSPTQSSRIIVLIASQCSFWLVADAVVNTCPCLKYWFRDYQQHTSIEPGSCWPNTWLHLITTPGCKSGNLLVKKSAIIHKSEQCILSP